MTKILIESKWNLKCRHGSSRTFCRNINRIKVEFKVRQKNKTSLEVEDINRIKVEFKEGQLIV